MATTIERQAGGTFDEPRVVSLDHRHICTIPSAGSAVVRGVRRRDDV
jgi:hypothetical protein